MVGAGAEHLVRQVAVAAVVLNDVEARVDRALGRLAELLFDLLETLDRQGVGSLELVGVVKEELGREAAVPELYAHPAANGVHGVGQLPELLDVLVGVYAHIHIGVRLRTDGGDLKDVQGASGLGLRNMVGDHVFAYLVLVADHLGVHAGKNDTVLKLQPAYLQGAKQCIKTHNFLLLLLLFCFDSGLFLLSLYIKPGLSPGSTGF